MAHAQAGSIPVMHPMPQKDKVKARANWKRWYDNNKKVHIARVRRNEKDRKRRMKEWFDAYKASLKCEACGFAHPAALDFHHKTGPKEFSIGLRSHSGWSIDRVKKEIEKCVVLCANCHRIHHWNERKNKPPYASGEATRLSIG